MARRSVLLLVAALIALAGTAMIVLYVQGIDARATKDQELVEVLVATETIDIGETVADAQDAGKIDKAEVRRADLVDGSLSSTTSIADDVAIGTIYPGEQLIAKKFGTLGDTQSLVIPDDMMAISVELTDFERVAGFVNPGNEVAVFATVLDPVRIVAGRQGAEARQLHADRPDPQPRARRRHHQRHLADDPGRRGRHHRGGGQDDPHHRGDPGAGREAGPGGPHRRPQLRAPHRRHQPPPTTRVRASSTCTPSCSEASRRDRHPRA